MGYRSVPDPSRSHGPDEGDEGDEGHAERRRDRCQDCGEDGAEAEGREGGLQRAERDRPVGGEEEREVHDPAAGGPEAEAQAREEGGDEGDVRQGGARGGQAREQGGQGIPRQGAQGLDLSPPSRQSSAAALCVCVDLSARRCYSWLCRGRPLALTYAGGGSWRKLYNALAPAWCH